MILHINNMNPKRVHINENKLSILAEDVYTNMLDNRNKRANITYKKGFDSTDRSKRPGETLKTDKMDVANSDTYIVPLKNGINSYNITDIEGKEIMHYFKRHFSKEATSFSINLNGKKEDYQLEMENSEINDFLKQFIEKINFIISDYVSKHKELTNRRIYSLSQVCIYPVKSSSNFNTKIVDLILKYKQNIFGLPVVKLNENLLKKDISKIQKDEDFIKNNADYYNSIREKSKYYYSRLHGNETHLNGLNSDLNMFKARNEVNKEIERVNSITKVLLTNLYQYRHNVKMGNEKAANNNAVKIATVFPEYCTSSQSSSIMKYSYYVDDYTGETIRKMNKDPRTGNLIYYQPKKSTKIPSVEQNTNEIMQIARQYNPEGYNSLPTKFLNNLEVMYREPINFQIKKIFNDSRMGLKNLFSFDEKELEMAKKQLEGNILVIFDDNVSGGATLSDICAQFLNVGIKHIIPITFGRMFQQWGGRARGGFMNVAAPPNGFVFGDNKTFVFNGHTFNTDEITNPMDAANLYTQRFGSYDKQGASELWNTYVQVKKSRNA